MLMPTETDAKDFMMRTVASTFRHALRSLNDRDSIELWKKLQPMFQMRLDFSDLHTDKGKAKPEQLSISDIHVELFKLETLY